MSGIWFDSEHARLKSYTAAVKGSKSTLRIDIECDEPRHLGYLLEQLGEIERDQKARAREQAALKQKATGRVLALPAPVPQLPYFGDDR